MTPFSPRTTADVAAEVGLTERTAQRRKQAAEGIAEDVRDAIRETPVAENQSELLKLARLDEEQQVAVAEKLVSGEAKSVADAARDVKREADERLAADTDAAQPDDQARSVQAGEWWSLGRHLLFCGDSSGDEFVQRAQGAAFAFADPPYGEAVGEWDGAFVWDHDWLAGAATVVAVTPGIANLLTFARLTEMPYKWTFACWINNGMTRGEMGFGNYIVAPLFSHGSIYRNAQDFMQVSISIAETSETDHRGRKPTGLVARLMELYSEQGQTVIDPFLGSGTTLLVAEKLGRACIGAEIVPDFCSQIIARWEGLTGEKAVLLPGEVREAA